MGGTIAGIAKDPLNYPLNYEAGQIPIEQLLSDLGVPDGISIQTSQIANINSCNLTEDLLSKLGNLVQQALLNSEIFGIVITHGTDTLEETGIYLDLCFSHLVHQQRKKIVLTGAMLPSNAHNADGLANLRLALISASAEQIQDGSRDVPEVLCAFAGKLYAARDICKRSADKLNAPVMDAIPIGDKKVFTKNPFDLLIPNGAWPWVEIITSHADTKPFVLEYLLTQSVAGVVIAGTGQGNIHTNLEHEIERAKKMDIPVIRSTRTLLGQIKPEYSTGTDFKMKTIPAGSLSPAKARIALQLLIYAKENDYLEKEGLDIEGYFATMEGYPING